MGTGSCGTLWAIKMTLAHTLSKMKFFCSVLSWITWSDLCSNRVFLATIEKGYCGSDVNAGEKESDSGYFLKVKPIGFPDRLNMELWEKGKSQEMFEAFDLSNYKDPIVINWNEVKGKGDLKKPEFDCVHIDAWCLIDFRWRYWIGNGICESQI